MSCHENIDIRLRNLACVTSFKCTTLNVTFRFPLRWIIQFATVIITHGFPVLYLERSSVIFFFIYFIFIIIACGRNC